VSAELLAVCVAGAGVLEIPGRRPTRSAIDKRPVDGRVAVRRLGLDGDVQVEKKYHGGDGQAVYAYAQEDADHWSAELDRELPPGRFGENLRTAGLGLTGAVIGERWRVGTALLEVAAPRTPCYKFQAHWGVPQLIKRFTAHGASGAYLRVLEPGEIGAGDRVEIVERPGHGITLGLAFRAFTTEKAALLAELGPVVDVLPSRNRATVTAAVAARAVASA
jgi:MOSC domain-containing protein YiiM